MKFTHIKSMIAMLLAITIFFTLIGCTGKPGADSSETKPTASGSEQDQPATTETPSTTSPTVETESFTFQEMIDGTTVHVLSKATVPYNEAYISAVHGIDYEDYDVATVLVVGIELPRGDLANEIYETKVAGETTLDPSGEPAVYSVHGGFMNEDKTYIINVYSIGGDVDPSKAEFTLKTYDGDVYTKKFENNGEPEGFDAIVPKFNSDYMKNYYGVDSKIVKLKGRYYACWNKRDSDYERGTIDGQDYQAIYEAITLIPLEGGFSQTIYLSDCQVEMPTDVAKTRGEFSMDNVVGVTDGTLDEPEVTTKLVLKVIRMIDEEKVDGKYTSDDENKFYTDLRQFRKYSSVSIPDGEGGTVTFTYGTKFY